MLMHKLCIVSDISPDVPSYFGCQDVDKFTAFIAV